MRITPLTGVVLLGALGLAGAVVHGEDPAPSCVPTCYSGFQAPQGHGTSEDGRLIVTVAIDGSWNDSSTGQTVNKIWNAVARALASYNTAAFVDAAGNSLQLPYYLKLDQSHAIANPPDINIVKADDCPDNTLACTRDADGVSAINGNSPAVVKLSSRNVGLAPDNPPSDPTLDNLAGRIAHEIAHKFGMQRKGEDPVFCVGETILAGDVNDNGLRYTNTVQPIDVVRMRDARLVTDLVCNDTHPATEVEPDYGSGGGDACDPGGCGCPEGYRWSSEVNLCVSIASPLVIGVEGEVKFSSLQDGVDFDLMGTGTPQRVAWPLSHDTGFVVADFNRNGVIDSGREMFGNFTLLVGTAARAANGFEALAQFDDDKNGVIDASDRVYSRLQWWVDANRNGLSEPQELISLPAAGIASISLAYQESAADDKWGNWFRFSAPVEMVRSERKRAAYDVYVMWAPGGVRPMNSGAYPPCYPK